MASNRILHGSGVSFCKKLLHKRSFCNSLLVKKRFKESCYITCSSISKRKDNVEFVFKREFSLKSHGPNSIKVKSSESTIYSSTFQQVMHLRKRQAQCSVLLELNTKADVTGATFACEKFGAIKTLHSYNGISNNVFLLLEFDDETSVSQLLKACHWYNVSDAFTSASRIISYTPKFQREVPKMTLEVVTDKPHSSKKLTLKSISDVIEEIPANERMSELSTRLRFFLCSLLKDSLSGLFPHAEVYPFGSSVNGYGKQGCDLDLMIRLYPVQNNKNSEFSFLNKTCIGKLQVLQGTSIRVLGDYFRNFMPGLSSVQKIVHAHVPILKFTHKLLGLECDVSINNMSPILMSEILYFCGEIDRRVCPLIYAVKKWAKLSSITYDVPGNWITNFGLTVLAIFFLQNRPVPILPKLIDVLQIAGAEFEPVYKIEYLTSLLVLQKKAVMNQESLADLLKEFLIFLGSHSFQNRHISIMTGLDTEKISDSELWVEYPMEPDRNVTRNVRKSELHDMCYKAQLSAEYLIKHLQSGPNKSTMDFSLLLGIPEILKFYSLKSKKRVRA